MMRLRGIDDELMRMQEVIEQESDFDMLLDEDAADLKSLERFFCFIVGGSK